MGLTWDYHGHADIVVVDDTPANLRLMMGLLEVQGFTIRPFLNGRLALKAIENTPPDLILLDVNMPEMDGYEVCRRLKADANLQRIPVIFISALTETFDKVKAFRAGGVDYITKPFHPEEVRVRIDTHLMLHRYQTELEHYNSELQERVTAQVREISDAQLATIMAMSKLAESRDDGIGKHLEHVQTFCKRLAQVLRTDPEYQARIDDAFVEDIAHASPLHDIGKVAIADNILLKPGKLTDDEFEIMKTHTIHGAMTLEAVRQRYPRNAFINMGIDIARSHHERWGGGGYPDGLVGEAIPLSAQIMAVADVYDALRAVRCYKSAFPHAEACDIIIKAEHTQFAPGLIRAFRHLADEFNAIRENMEETDT